jgi:glycosyltransferase involved in cell wall biosynthesis
MKIGIYGGIANNMYVFAKALSQHGVELCFIRDRSDRYPMSQPVWEDVSFNMAYDEVPKAGSWSWESWSRKERELEWTAPAWLFDPLSDSGGQAHVAAPSTSFIDTLYLKRFVRASHRAPVLRKMQTCDVVLVCGAEGSLLAHASGRPFVIWPHGGDALIAAGLLQPRFLHIRPRLAHAMLRRQLVTAYASAICLGSHEPTGICADYLGAEHFIRTQRLAFLPIPIPLRTRLPDAGQRRRALNGLLARLGVDAPSSDYVGFVPSRVDYQWKGQDRVLRALLRLKREGKAAGIHLIFSGWGVDFHAARRFVQDNGLNACATFLDCALSKPFLFQFYSSADFVVDQFVLGMCGTSALEAMSCGAPLIAWNNNAAVERPWGAPPLLEARTEDDILAVLRKLADGHLDLQQTGASLQQWLGRVFDPATAASRLMSIFAGGYTKGGYSR